MNAFGALVNPPDRSSRVPRNALRAARFRAASILTVSSFSLMEFSEEFTRTNPAFPTFPLVPRIDDRFVDCLEVADAFGESPFDSFCRDAVTAGFNASTNPG